MKLTFTEYFNIMFAPIMFPMTKLVNHINKIHPLTEEQKKKIQNHTLVMNTDMMNYINLIKILEEENIIDKI